MTSDITNGDFSIAQLITQMKVNALKNRELFIWGEIDENEELIVNRWLEKIIKSDARKDTPLLPIRINISSPGGSVFSGLSIISQLERMRDLGYEIQTCSYGMCMSAALFIYMIGTTRLAQRHTRFMLHQPSIIGFMGSSSVETSKRTFRDLDEIWNRLKDIVKNYTDISDDLLDQITSTDKDYFFFPEEGIDLGIVDRIL